MTQKPKDDLKSISNKTLINIALPSIKEYGKMIRKQTAQEINEDCEDEINYAIKENQGKKDTSFYNGYRLACERIQSFIKQKYLGDNE